MEGPVSFLKFISYIYVSMRITIFRFYLKTLGCFNNKLLVTICCGVQDALTFDIYCISDHFQTDTIAV